MPAKRDLVCLTDEERQTLEELTTKGKAAARTMNQARLLLKADIKPPDGGWSEPAISQALKKSLSRKC